MLDALRVKVALLIGGHDALGVGRIFHGELLDADLSSPDSLNNMLDLRHTAQETRAVDFQLAIFDAQTKLHSEKVTL